MLTLAMQVECVQSAEFLRVPARRMTAPAPSAGKGAVIGSVGLVIEESVSAPINSTLSAARAMIRLDATARP
ncbi:hypothetical protein H074_36249 [Amycolatopsis decaplanina DSM 44594]|uniref:Uncharacterized protein n=1 Tax=Amycolatopsis decaplanina DSM 44594 TaxID=1284240 RepID=M2WSL3_9PSEU|nr:hypothetical protein H074_36249 [Amycolatopsis decaplanina DSM 44594]